NVAPAANGAQAPRGAAPLLRPCQKLVLQPDDLDERLDGLQVRKLHPPPPYPRRLRPATDRLTQRLGHAVADGELTLLELRQHERAADARFHGMEVAELAPADLVHPHPLPRGAHEHHLLGDVLERADALALLPEAPRRARRPAPHSRAAARASSESSVALRPGAARSRTLLRRAWSECTRCNAVESETTARTRRSASANCCSRAPGPGRRRGSIRTASGWV